MQTPAAPLATAVAVVGARATRLPRRPNLSLLADRCATPRALARVHAAMLVSGRLADDAFAASRLLAAYAAVSPDPAAAALALLSSLPCAPNSFMLNTTLRALTSSPDPASAFPFFARLRATGTLAPGRHTFPFLLKAAARLPLPLPVAEQLHALAVRHGVHLDAYVANGLVRAYSVAGRLRAARRVFDELPERNVAVYTTMVSAYAQNGRHENAIGAFDEMVHEGFEPGGAALASVLSACARSASGGLEMGRRVHDLMEARGMAAPLGVVLGTALVDMYAKNGAIRESVAVFDGMRERRAATWNALISGLAHHGHGERALAMFQRMQREGVPPNATTLVGALSACCHAGLLDEARRLFRSMEKDFGIAPGIQHYGCMVNLLGRAGLLAEAEEMIRGMTCEADTVIWGALLTACKNHGDVEIAEQAVVEMLKLDPSNHGVYVVLSNMYAEAGRWQDVDKLRKVMKGARLSKIPGASAVGGDASPEQPEQTQPLAKVLV
ncbi:pentatricopeptide repeat-containing protein At5g56310-like [Phragmites australis]|uniref:pentatricopeptide repeat-containing protein At5g56310-like n=1 Tax=Phragmites australis TaxID=29695 RepID=UPI002D766FE6|nr:pentatricopeptide repeat-containing protein At5g56310-like [Phragmites australis]